MNLNRMRVQLEYATAPHATPAWVWGLLGVAVLTAVASGWTYAGLQAEQAGLSLKLAARTQPRSLSKPTVSTASAQADQQEQAKQANAVLAELGKPWLQLLSQLEAAASGDVALLQIRPEAGKDRIHLVGEARRLTDVLDYVRRLAVEGGMRDVVLEQHEVMEADPQKPIRFALSARWGVAE